MSPVKWPTSFTTISQDNLRYKYPMTMHAGSDITNGEIGPPGDFPPVNYYLRDDDVCSVIGMMYGEHPHEDQAQECELSFFGTRGNMHHRHLIMTYTYEPDSS